jgi:hypothetical protein
VIDLLGERKHCESEHTLAVFTETKIDSLEFLFFLRVDLFVFAFKEGASAIFPYFLWGSFDIGNVDVISSLVAHDGKSVFVGGVERHFGL